MLIPSFVKTPEELDQIARLSAANLVTNLTEAEKAKEGFVTWPYTPESLRTLHSVTPSIQVKDGGRVVGYAIVLTRECAAVYPPFEEAMHYYGTVPYQGKSLLDYRVYFMGQICIHPDYRGKGVFGLLYSFHRQQLSPKYEMLVTEISTANLRSLRAHRRLGFVIIDTRRDEMDEWDLVVWDWR
ncbi:MAG TPA: GNAT family N-acetyltransferase [Puia sp.]|jgi:GNAT superfamily N-acetyltransferase|nr:GNAT family N-acetyltransferase [Puia sp.]